MSTQTQLNQFEIVLVSPRNPLNIGAAARAMANFGFRHLSVVHPYEPSWRTACSAVGAEELLQEARCYASVAEAVAGCTLIAGTGTLTYRKAEQQTTTLPGLFLPVSEALASPDGRVAILFGSEKHGLTREDLSWCHLLVEIPTDARQPSMNLGQAVAVTLYELAMRLHESPSEPPTTMPAKATSARLDLLAEVVEETWAAANYSPAGMRPANQRDLRLMLRRLAPSEQDARRLLGGFRRMLWRLQRKASPVDRKRP